MLVINLTYGHISVVDSMPRGEEKYKHITEKMKKTLAAVGTAMQWQALTRIHTVVMAEDVCTPEQEYASNDCAVLMLRSAAAVAAQGPDPLPCWPAVTDIHASQRTNLSHIQHSKT